MSDLLKIEDIGDIIYSKRDTMSELALKKAKGILVNRLEIIKSEKQKQLEKERKEKEIIEWKLKHDNKYPLIFRKLYREEEYEEQLKFYNSSLLNEKEISQFENISVEDKKEEDDSEKIKLSVLDISDEDLSKLLLS